MVLKQRGTAKFIYNFTRFTRSPSLHISESKRFRHCFLFMDFIKWTVQSSGQQLGKHVKKLLGECCPALAGSVGNGLTFGPCVW